MIEPDYIIRRVEHTPQTEVALRFMQKQCLPSDRVLCPAQGWWWIIYFHGELAGFGSMLQSPKWSDCAYLSRAGVLEPHRGKGLQKRLIRLRCRFARAIGMNWVITDTTDNVASSNSLISEGFKMFDPTEPWALPHSAYWRKNLAVQGSS